MLKYQVVPVTRLEQNCSIVWCDQTMCAAVIDPGGDIPRILAAVEQLGVKLEQIWVTHGHFDHVGGVALLAKQLALPIYGPNQADDFLIQNLPHENVEMYTGYKRIEAFEPARWLNDGDTLTLGEESVLVRHCPGHTPGHVVFYSASAQHAFVGDVLFAGSIGRTDFPGGNHEQLIASIVQRLWPLGDTTRFTPGHGPDSTFGRERQTNPFVGGT